MDQPVLADTYRITEGPMVWEDVSDGDESCLIVFCISARIIERWESVRDDRSDAGHGAKRPTVSQAAGNCRCSLNALRDGERKFQCYALHSFVVMPNHVHLLVTPTVVATKWLAPMRGLTTYQGNRILGRQGAFCKVRATITWFEARRSFREFGDISS